MTTQTDIRLARNLWRVTEPYHQLSYRSPEAEEEYVALGLDRPELRYFGSRLAALGPIGLHTATAVLYGFAPSYIAKAIPELWSIAEPKDISRARLTGAQRTLQRVIGDATESQDMTKAAALARAFVDATDFAGRPVGAAHADLPWPDSPAMVLWHACTTLREHRGDAHWAATSAEGIDPVECHILHAADGAMPADLLQRVSGWNDQAWGTAVDRLRSRSLLASDALSLTSSGATIKARIEDATDRAAAAALWKVGSDSVELLTRLMRPWVDQIMGSGVVAAWKMREELWRDLPASH
jgi:hypothetical protein